MSENIRRRPLYRRSERTVVRPVGRSVLRSATRSAVRNVWRTVIPYDGPSLNDICRLLSRYVRLAEAYDKKWNPDRHKRRFKPLLSPEESRRKFEEDLKRCYGDGNQNGSAVGVPNQPPSPGKHRRPACDSQRPAENSGATDKPNASPPPANEKTISVSTEKKDVTAVPLVITPNGLLGLDWSAAR